MAFTMSPRLSLLAYYIFLFSSTCAVENYPDNCPGTFKYSHDWKFGGHYGLVTVQKDASSISELQINMTTNTRHYLYNKLQIIVLSRTQEFFNSSSILKYAVLFPEQDSIPKLISLQFNGRTLCLGVTDPLMPGLIQTHMWAKSVVTTYGGSVQSDTIHPFLPQALPQVSTTLKSTVGQHNNPFFQGSLANDQFVAPTSQSIISTSPDTVIPNLQQCGDVTNVQSLIIKGDYVAPGDFPWLAAIMYRKERDYNLHCTGNLISNEHVLTAGHCVNSANTSTNNYDNLVIILGQLAMNNWTRDGIVRRPRAIVTHPDYKDNNAASDIAIIVLREPVTFTPTVRPICLWSGNDSLDEIVGTLGTVAGWAQSEPEVASHSRAAQKVEMPVVSQEQCLRSNKVFKRFTSSGTFCAGNSDSSGPCMGDSGAGFAIKDDSTKKWFLRGLVGFSIRDPVSLSCDLNSFVIFTDVAKIRLWIYQEMQKHR